MKKIFLFLILFSLGIYGELHAQKWILDCYYFKQKDSTAFCKVKFFDKDTCTDSNKMLALEKNFYYKDVEDVSDSKVLHDSLYRFYYRYLGAKPKERLHILQVCTRVSAWRVKEYSLEEKKACACLTGNFETDFAHFSFVPLYDMEVLTGYKMPKYQIDYGTFGINIYDYDKYLATTKEWQERIDKQDIVKKDTVCIMDMPTVYTDLKLLDNYIRRGIYERLYYAEFIFRKLRFSERLYNLIKLDLDTLCKVKTSSFFANEKIKKAKLKNSIKKWKRVLKKG